MLRHVAFLMAILLGASPSVYAQNFTSKAKKIAISAPEKFLRAGEMLTYSVEWLGVPIGTITLKTIGTEVIQGAECYHITASAVPNQFLRAFWDVEYQVHTYIDTETHYSRRFEKIRRLQTQSSSVIIDFDHKKGEVNIKNEGPASGVHISTLRAKLEEKVKPSLKIAPGAQDLLSSFYYLRMLGLEPGKNYPITIYYERRNWPVDIKIEEPFMRDFRRKGVFTVFKAAMDSSLSSFILGGRQLTVYFTADPSRVPLEFKFNTSLGPIRGIIQGRPQ